MAQAVKQNIGRRWLLLGALVILVLVFFGVRSLTREKLPLRVAEVVRGDLVSQISTNGKAEPQEGSNFEAHSPIATTVKNLFVHEGDKVPAGKLLLVLNASDALARVAAASTSVKGAQATYDAMQRGGTQEERLSLSGDLSKAKIERDNASQSLDSLERLQKSGSASASEVTSARQRLNAANNQIHLLEERQASRYAPADLDHARAALQDAQANYTAARTVVTESNVRAPFAGTVYSLPVSWTEFVEQGRLLLQMADLSHIQVRAYFDEPELGKLAVGQPIKIVWDARLSRTWHGHIARVPSTIITYGTRNVGEVLIAVDDSDEQLLPNTNVTVTVTTQHEENVLSIPREALHTENGKDFVYVFRNGVIRRTSVKLGTINLTQVGIAQGLKEHDVVALGSTNGQPLSNDEPSRIVN